MKKSLLRVVLAVLLGVTLFVVVRELTKPQTQTGEKAITIQIIVIEGSSDMIFNETIQTDATFLAQVLEEIDELGLIEVHLGGSKSDQFGRFLIGFDEHVTDDMSVGPWWGYTSDTNPDCISAGFCSGVDMAPVYDQDTFVFTLDKTN